jgi:hypothetical protein
VCPAQRSNLDTSLNIRGREEACFRHCSPAFVAVSLSFLTAFIQQVSLSIQHNAVIREGSNAAQRGVTNEKG